MKRSLWLLCAAILCGGCDRDAASPPPQRAEVGAPAPSPALGDVALQAPEGDGPEVAQVSAAQEEVRKLPDRADGWATLASAWARCARAAQRPALMSRAEDAARRALALSPAQAQARAVLGLCLRERHRFGELKALAQEMTRAQPRDPQAWGLLGDAALELGELEEAERAYQEMIDLYPNLASYSRVAWLRWLHGDEEGAVEMWELALASASRSDPEPMAFCLSELGHLEWARGDLGAALRRYEAALAVMPAHAPSLFGKGRALLAQGQPAAAVEALQRSFDQRHQEQTWIWLSLAARAADQPALADEIERRLAQASELDDPRSLSLYLSTRRLQPARAVALARADAKERGDLFTQDALAFALFRDGQRDEALQRSRLAVQTSPPDPCLLGRAGLIEASVGDPGRAVTLLRASLSRNPWCDPALRPELEAALERLSPTEAP